MSKQINESKYNYLKYVLLNRNRVQELNRLSNLSDRPSLCRISIFIFLSS